MPRRKRRPNERTGETPANETSGPAPAEKSRETSADSGRPDNNRPDRPSGQPRGGQRNSGQRPGGATPGGRRPGRPPSDRRGRPPADRPRVPQGESQNPPPENNNNPGSPSSGRPANRPSGRPDSRPPGRSSDRPSGRSGRSPSGRSYDRFSNQRSRRYQDFDRFSDFTPSEPIRTNRGIKARSQRGSFGEHWWAHRWIEAMERLVEPPRLQRGRSYARSGQVLSIQETNHGVEAKVQGSRPTPYKVTIQVTPLRDRQWEQVIDAMSEQALFTAQLLAGEMPDDIEEAFKAAGVSLFPDSVGDLVTDCSCPDWANPCKHVAATQYILGDMFDDDPFLLFRMRGRNQEQILQALRARRAGPDEPVEAQEEAPVETESYTPLAETLDQFWVSVDSLDTFPLTIRPAAVDMPLLKRLGEPAFLNKESLETLLKPVYDTFMRSALLAAYSEEEPYESSANGSGSGGENGNGSGSGLE